MKKSRICLLMCSVCAVLTVSGCSLNIDDILQSSGEGSWGGVSFSEGYSRNESSYEYKITDHSENYRYSVKNTLTEKQVELYNRFVAMIEEYNTSFEFENEDKDDVKAAYYAVLDDHPEYFWLGRNYTYSTTSWGDYSSVTVEPVLYSSDKEKIKAAEQKLNSAADAIAAQANFQVSTYEKILYVHDHILDNTYYDRSVLNAVDNNDKELILASTAYGCLCEGKAVCSGYSAAFQLVMHRLGIECGKVNGTRISEDGSHQWNFVKLEDGYYFMDLTWDDPITESGEPKITHEYFLLTADDLKMTHTPNNELPYPEFTGSQYNYYTYNGLYFQYYDFESVRQAAAESYGSGYFTVKFSSPQELQRAVEDLIDNKRVFDIDGVGSGVSYSISSSGCILSVTY